MNRVQLPMPPHPDSYNDDEQWQRAVYQWMSDAKVEIESNSARNVSPIGPFVTGTYTAVSTITGTDVVSNFVATLVAAMNAKGITTPTSGR